MDFNKAYDCIHNQHLNVNDMNEWYDIYPKSRRLELTLTNIKSKVKFREEISEEFTINTGLIQVDELSPVLFSVVLDYVMKILFKENPQNIKIVVQTNNYCARLSCLVFGADLGLDTKEMCSDH